MLSSALKNEIEIRKAYASNVENAKEKVQDCEKALEALKNETGDTSEQEEKLKEELAKANAELQKAEQNHDAAARKCNSYQTQLNNAETELNKLSSEIDKNNGYLDEAAKSSDGCASSIDEYGKEVKEAGEESEKAGEKFEKVKGAAVALGTAAAAATAALAAAAIKLGTEVVTAYADYEQLVGGVETLFKDSSGQVVEYANNAYKTAGLSANEYMETVTAFSASLISSLGGDTAEAAKYIDYKATMTTLDLCYLSIERAYTGGLPYR